VYILLIQLKGVISKPTQSFIQLYQTEEEVKSSDYMFPSKSQAGEIESDVPSIITKSAEVLKETLVYDISSSGDVFMLGDITASNDTFTVKNGIMTVDHVNVMHSLDVIGSVTVEDELTIGSGFALTPNGMTIDTARHDTWMLLLVLCCKVLLFVLPSCIH
jgi:hypothetical protein